MSSLKSSLDFPYQAAKPIRGVLAMSLALELDLYCLRGLDFVMVGVD